MVLDINVQKLLHIQVGAVWCTCLGGRGGSLRSGDVTALTKGRAALKGIVAHLKCLSTLALIVDLHFLHAGLQVVAEKIADPAHQAHADGVDVG